MTSQGRYCPWWSLETYSAQTIHSQAQVAADHGNNRLSMKEKEPGEGSHFLVELFYIIESGYFWPTVKERKDVQCLLYSFVLSEYLLNKIKRNSMHSDVFWHLGIVDKAWLV